jgi:hypothetical protein
VGCCSEGLAKQKMIEDITFKILDLGSVSVRRVRDEFYFHKELLTNPELKDGFGWNFSPSSHYDNTKGLMVVSINNLGTQAVNMLPGTRYLNSVIARCAKDPGIGRVQINWANKNGKFIGANIKTFDCAPMWSEISMEGVVPKEAKTAIVYVVGHTATPIEYKKVSLRQ